MRAHDERGVFSVEVVLLVPLMLVLVFLVLEFGRVFGQWLIVTNAAREGARFAITQSFDSSQDTAIRQRVVQTAQGLESSQPLQAVACQSNQPPSGSTSCVGITRITCPDANYTTLCNNSSESFVTILVRYRVIATTPITGNIPFIGPVNYPGTVEITGLSTMRAL
jgi:Flp pilus assembly protein TadG